MRRFVKGIIWISIGIVILFLLAEVFGYAFSLYLSARLEGLIFSAISIIAVILLKKREHDILLFFKIHYKRLLIGSPLILVALFFILFGILRPLATTIAEFPAYYLTGEQTNFALLWKDNLVYEYHFWFGSKE